jgi:hypothetical protein
VCRCRDRKSSTTRRGTLSPLPRAVVVVVVVPGTDSAGGGGGTLPEKGGSTENTERKARRCDTVGTKTVRRWRVVESWDRLGVRRGCGFSFGLGGTGWGGGDCG